MTSAISSAANLPQHVRSVAPQQVKVGTDSDGDNDGSKPGEVETAQPKVVTATVGNNINTTA